MARKGWYAVKETNQPTNWVIESTFYSDNRYAISSSLKVLSDANQDLNESQMMLI